MVLIMINQNHYLSHICMVKFLIEYLKKYHFSTKFRNILIRNGLSINETIFVVSDIYNRKIGSSISFTNKSKLFNYCIQLLETENNIRMLDDLLPLLKGKKTKLILYSYDSFLFDFHKDDGMDFLKEIKKVIEQNNSYPVKVGWGTNYHKLEDITEKFND